MLLQLYRRATSIVIENFEFYKITEDLAKDGFAGALAALREKAAAAFGVPLSAVAPQKGSLTGDLFFLDDDKLLYLKCRRQPGQKKTDDPFDDPGALDPEVNFEAGMIAPVGSDSDELERLCSSISTILEVEFNAEEVAWTEPGIGAEGLGEIGQPAVIEDTHLELAAILREAKIAPFLDALKTDKGEIILDEWLADRDDADEVEYFIDKLFEADFFDEDVIVYSMLTGKPLIRAKDRAGLEALKSAGVRDVNGDELDLENVRRMLILPKEKREFIRKSWVSRVILVDLLRKMGVPRHNIIDIEGPAGTAVIAATFDGTPLVFVLADDEVKPEDFADLADDLGKLGEPTVVVVTGKKVDTDAARAAGAEECLVLAGVDEFNTTLLEQLAASRKGAVAEIIADYDNMFAINFSEMAMRRFQDPAEEA
ncbi:MAG: hypothetical protein P9L99_17910 [Candidatus Lernaella stagnicola]|nr:hypothetical protein [Candidatus Lernaella stagnicola]